MKYLLAADFQGNIKAEKVLEINANHDIYAKLQQLYESDKDKLAKVAEVIYNQALLIEGMPIDNPTKLAGLVCELI